VNYLAEPKSLFNFAFDLVRGGLTVGRVQHRLFGRKGVIEVDGIEYEVYRTGPVAFALAQVGVPGAVVSAERPGLLRSRYRITWNGEVFDLVRSGLGFRMRLMRGSEEIGWIRVANLFSRRLLLDVPEELPVTVVAFLVWLMVRMRRAAASAAAAGG
jgi:hypothetical protein